MNISRSLVSNVTKGVLRSNTARHGKWLLLFCVYIWLVFCSRVHYIWLGLFWKAFGCDMMTSSFRCQHFPQVAGNWKLLALRYHTILVLLIGLLRKQCSCICFCIFAFLIQATLIIFMYFLGSDNERLGNIAILILLSKTCSSASHKFSRVQ